ncbi:hypothetical protein [Vallitalea guaymasensis]|uniref:hypothetical protein n=1 Tax=Vallitalea guaymasensis TaxID=1185412 RepID=UPI000DE40F8D|nr:hypothetical protein [Vallitalea guaymasensis]
MNKNSIKVYSKITLLSSLKRLLRINIFVPNKKYYIGIGKLTIDETLLVKNNAYLKHEYQILADKVNNNFILVNK